MYDPFGVYRVGAVGRLLGFAPVHNINTPPLLLPILSWFLGLVHHEIVLGTRNSSYVLRKVLVLHHELSGRRLFAKDRLGVAREGAGRDGIPHHDPQRPVDYSGGVEDAPHPNVPDVAHP